MPNYMRTKKTLAVLGLDAMPWSYLEKLIEKGVMPYTKHLLQKSLKADLEAYPPSTPPSWSSIMTGVNPGKHGIFGFFHYNKRTWEQRLYTAHDLKHPRLHEMLSFLGYRSIVFNPIPDYPLIPVRNAEIISNLFFTPKPLSYPADIYRKYFSDENPQNYTTDLTCKILEDYNNVIELYQGAIEKALSKHSTLLWVTFNAPDILFHRCPQILYRNKLMSEEVKIFKNIDKIVKMLDQSYDSIIIVSDHGFGRYNWLVSINDILVKHKLASVSNKPAFKDISEHRIDAGAVQVEQLKRVKVPVRLYKFVKLTGLKYLLKFMLKLYRMISGKKVIFDTSMWVDAENSIAVMPEHNVYGIYVKEQNKIEYILEILKNYEKYLSYSRPEHVYTGPYVNEAPDIIVFPKFDKGYWITENLIGSVTTKGEYYAHHPLGLLILKDENSCRPAYDKLLLPNYSVTLLALQSLELPLPKSRDRIKEPGIEECTKGPEYDYLSKWNILMRTRKVKLKSED